MPYTTQDRRKGAPATDISIPDSVEKVNTSAKINLTSDIIR